MKDKIENLIKEWEKQRSDILALLEKQKHNEQHQFKLTYKALQLKYCIKDLRCILEEKCKNQPCYPNLSHGVLVCDNCDYSEI